MAVIIDGIKYLPAEMQVAVRTCETCDPNSGFLLESFERELRHGKRLRSDFKDIGGVALSMSDAEGYIRGLVMAIAIIKDVFGIEE